MPKKSKGPAPIKSAAVRMLTRSVARPEAAGGGPEKARRVTDVARPSRQPAAGGTGRKVRRGASKGR